MMSTIPLTFPSFNLHSTPLLVLVAQGLVFSVLLIGKYRKRKSIPYLLLGFILLITCYHRTTYTIGFMDWYDTYRNTKINYYLINLELVLIPLIYFYVRSITRSDFKFNRKHLWHFVPGTVYILIKLFVLAYDASQPGFDDTQNGYLVQNFQWKYVDPFHSALTYIQTVAYLVLTIQLYYSYRKNIQQYFSNTYRLELNWMRNFLLIYTVLFVYGSGQTLVNLTIAELSWTQKWWLHFFTALAIIYIGVKGYFTNTDALSGLEFDGSSGIVHPSSLSRPTNVAAHLDEKKAIVASYFANEKPYLDPDLNLISLSQELGMTRAEVSEIINQGFGKNFNDFVNFYRVEAIKMMFEEGKQQQMSLLGVALECGFNSKATFNRVFKKFTQMSPSQYLSSR